MAQGGRMSGRWTLTPEGQEGPSVLARASSRDQNRGPIYVVKMLLSTWGSAYSCSRRG